MYKRVSNKATLDTTLADKLIRQQNKK